MVKDLLANNIDGHVIYFCDEKHLNSRGSKEKGESLGKFFYSLSFNCQKFPISPNQSHNNQTNNQSMYLL